MSEDAHDIQFPKVPCALCKEDTGRCDDPDTAGKVCVSCYHDLEQAGQFLRFLTEYHHTTNETNFPDRLYP